MTLIYVRKRTVIKENMKGRCMETVKILVTGGSGFVGQHIVRKFVENRQEVYVLDVMPPSLSYGKYVAGDVFDSEKLFDVVKKVDVVVHLVGLADAGLAQREPDESFRLNVSSLQNVLEACRVNNNKKLIFPSSATVYGIPEILPIKENHPLNPTNIYSWHKYICEQLIKAYHNIFGLNYVILRLFNVYGKGNKGVIHQFLKKAIKGEVIESFGPYQYRDFVYVGDVAEAFYKAAVYEKATNKVINIGSGVGIQIKELLDFICEIIPNTRWIHKKEKFVMYDSIADITLAKILLDFKPHDSKDFMKQIIKSEMLEEVLAKPETS